MTVAGRQYSSLFWEADTHVGCTHTDTPFPLRIDTENSFCVEKEGVGAFLDDMLSKLGLSVRERTDMVSYWMPQLQDHSFFQFQFFDECSKYAELARLDVQGEVEVDTEIRVFMVFRGLAEEIVCGGRMPEVARERKGTVLVEWGGMNLLKQV
jgi:hypothetical protein